MKGNRSKTSLKWRSARSLLLVVFGIVILLGSSLKTAYFKNSTPTLVVQTNSTDDVPSEENPDQTTSDNEESEDDDENKIEPFLIYSFSKFASKISYTVHQDPLLSDTHTAIVSPPPRA
jgi:hypothetical protein